MSRSRAFWQRDLLMTKLLSLIAIASLTTGCATIFNHRNITVQVDPDVQLDGQSGEVTVDQREPHLITYADGSRCEVHPGVSVSYIILDIFLTGPIGLIIDGVTSNWTVAKVGDCHGVSK